jgi:hypothetical protein
MAAEPRKSSKPKSKSDSKKTETVHLSPEELRKISGGLAKNNPNPSPIPDAKPIIKH